MEELPTLTPDKDHRLTVVDGPDCPVLTFGFSAEDPDVTQLLNVRWYVDYPRVRVFDLNNEQVLTPSSTGRLQRDDQGSETVDLASPALQAPLSQLQLRGPHIVEAVLFDFHLDANRNPVPISGTDAGILNPSYAVSYAWVVDMERICPPPP
jgi:hypothetical protein